MGDEAKGATDATSGAGAKPDQASKGSDTGAGAKPPAGKDPADESAKGEEALGDNGQKVLREARQEAREATRRAEAAESDLTKLREETASDSDKALNQARREASAERDAFWQSHIREAEVRGALRGAGITNDKFLSLAVAAPEFRELKVGEDGSVSGVTAAIEGFKEDYPEAFSKAPPAKPDGEWDGAAGGNGSGGKKPLNLEDAVAAEIGEQFKQQK